VSGGGVRLGARRSLDERLFVRWPGAFAAGARAVSHLPERSRLRRAVVRRTVKSGWAAWARGDLDLLFLRYAPDVRLEPPREWTAAGMRPFYEGHEGWREWAADWRGSWEEMELTSFEVASAGNPAVVLGHLRLRARGSGIALDSPYGSVYWTERGLIVRECHFVDLDEARRAGGLPTSGL
jgi:ketosteroid isomerase-like protein